MEELKEYFTNLLILQYRNKPKAKATVEALVTETYADDNNKVFALEVEKAYDIDTAIGTQLDVIGKYLGYDRVLNFPIDNNFIYAEYDDSNNPTKGYAEYSIDKETYPYKEYEYSKYQQYNIKDTTYRKLLKMISELKNKVLSLETIDSVLDEYFEDDIYLVENDKNIEYHIEFDSYLRQVINTQEKANLFINKYFPKPIGCGIEIILDGVNLLSYGGATYDSNYIYDKHTYNLGSYFYKDIDLSSFDYTTDDIEILVKTKLDSAEYTGSLYVSSDFEETSNNFNFSFLKLGNQLSGRGSAVVNNFSLDLSSISTAISQNDWFYVKYTFTHGTNLYEIFLSTDKETWTSAGSYTQSAWSYKIKDMNKIVFGKVISQGTFYSFYGSVDFKECYIKVNDSYLWKSFISREDY